MVSNYKVSTNFFKKDNEGSKQKNKQSQIPEYLDGWLTVRHNITLD
jgi:hypothetical protein